MDLILNLKGEYFDAIKSGEKTEEYRLVNPYWTSRLVGREYGNLVLKRGYPARGDADRHLILKYSGYCKKEIIHPHFGDEAVEVFAIKLIFPGSMREIIKTN